MRLVSRVLIVHRRLVLVVAHGDDPARAGIPGGGIEPGETPEVAAMRELREETGLICEQLAYRCTVDEPDRGPEGTRTYVFVATASGQLRRSHEGHPMWMRPADVVRGRYGDFHQIVFEEAMVRT